MLEKKIKKERAGIIVAVVVLFMAIAVPFLPTTAVAADGSGEDLTLEAVAFDEEMTI